MTATRGTELSVRDRVLAFCQRRVSSWWPRVRILPTHRTIVQETIPKANLPRTSRTSKRRAAGRKPWPMLWNGRCPSRCGSPGRVWSVVWLRRERTFRHHAQGSTTVDNILLSVWGLDVFRFFDRRVTLEELCVAHVTPLIL